MSIDTYHQLKEADDASAHQYLVSQFDALFSEATGLFAAYGWGALSAGLLVTALALGSLWRLRQRLPWRWVWLIPVLFFSIYAGIKASVIVQLIERAPALPQMWELYFRYWTPLKMMRTSVSGLLLTTCAMWALVWWRGKGGRSGPLPD